MERNLFAISKLAQNINFSYFSTNPFPVLLVLQNFLLFQNLIDLIL
jgi:hypothetical protein